MHHAYPLKKSGSQAMAAGVAVGTLIVVGLLYYWDHPPLGFFFLDAWLLGVILVGGLGFAFQLRPDARFLAGSAWADGLLFAGLVVATLVLVATVSSWSFFHAEDYFKQLGKEVSHRESRKTLPPLDFAQAPLVSDRMATRAAEKRLADIPSLGSQAELGPMTKQLVKGKLVWVSFLQHRGFFPWHATGGTPGYVVVSAHDPNDVEMVTEIKGAKLNLRYLPSSFLHENAVRRVQFNGQQFIGVTDFTAEIDDNGRPFYTATIFQPSIGFDGAEAVGVALLDVQTGDVTTHALSAAPAWVDRVQPGFFMAQQIQNRGHFANGRWWNPENKDRFKLSGDIDLVYGQNGRAQWYAGLTSTGKDKGLIGFMLVDSITKEVHQYQISGATEDVAAHAAEQVFPEKGYHATNMLPFMVHGVPTYVSTLTESSGVPRAFALVSIENYQLLAVADTLQQAVRLYEMRLTQNKVGTDATATAADRQLTGAVKRIASEVRNGNTLYYVLLPSAGGDVTLSGNSDLSEDLPLTKEGDRVDVGYRQGAVGSVGVLSRFENRSLKIKP